MRRDYIAFKLMTNGNIRAYQSNTSDKRGVTEWMITDVRNACPTLIAGNVPKVIIYDKDNTSNRPTKD